MNPLSLNQEQTRFDSQGLEQIIVNLIPDYISRLQGISITYYPAKTLNQLPGTQFVTVHTLPHGSSVNMRYLTIHHGAWVQKPVHVRFLLQYVLLPP